MRQVLFRIPVLNVPIYGFGMMLFCAFIICTWLASRRAKKEGIAKEFLQDLSIWIFVGGLLGARIVYMIQYHEPITKFFMIWQGGLVFYGSAVGGLVGYALAYFFVIRKYGLSTWKLADIIAPSAAVGLCLGRIGCFLNGCCWGNVACEHCPGIAFPISSPARYSLVEQGYQTAAGFTTSEKDSEDPRLVRHVMVGSPADASDLRPGDLIVKADGQGILRLINVEVREGDRLIRHQFGDLGTAKAAVADFQKSNHDVVQVYDDLSDYLTHRWPRGKTDLNLTVRRGENELELAAFYPRTLALHPTQVYESTSMILVFLLLSAFYPMRRHDGEVMVLFILCYSAHRFVNEMLRNDTDPVAFNMTLSQNGSIFFFVLGLLLLVWLLRKPPDHVSTSTAY